MSIEEALCWFIVAAGERESRRLLMSNKPSLAWSMVVKTVADEISLRFRG